MKLLQLSSSRDMCAHDTRALTTEHKTYLLQTMPRFTSLRPQTQLVLGPRIVGQNPWAVKSFRGGTLSHNTDPRETLHPHEIWDMGDPVRQTAGFRVGGPGFTEHLLCMWVPCLLMYIISVLISAIQDVHYSPYFTDQETKAQERTVLHKSAHLVNAGTRI